MGSNMQEMQGQMSSLELTDSNKSFGCQCGAAIKLAEVMEVNRCWDKDYNELLEECKYLRKTENQLRQVAKEFKEMRKNAEYKNKENKVKLMEQSSEIEALRQQLVIYQEQLLQEKGEGYNELLEECKYLRKTESQSRQVAKEFKEVRKNAEYKNKENEVKLTEQNSEIEALRQQLVIYEEQFLQEKDEFKKLLMENCTVKSHLQKANETIENLTSKNGHLKEKLQHVYMEKESIISELKRLTSNSMDSRTGMSVPHTCKPEVTGATSSQDVMPVTARIVIPPAGKFYGRRNIERD